MLPAKVNLFTLSLSICLVMQNILTEWQQSCPRGRECGAGGKPNEQTNVNMSVIWLRNKSTNVRERGRVGKIEDKDQMVAKEEEKRSTRMRESTRTENKTNSNMTGAHTVGR